MYQNPLIEYHNFLRASAPAGYPNATMMSPHPYEMQQFAMNGQRMPPFRYNRGRFQRMPIQVRRMPMHRMTR